MKTIGSKIQTLLKYRGKIQILKYQDVKSRHHQSLGGKIQILKLQGVKSNYPQTLGVNLQFTLNRNKNYALSLSIYIYMR